MYDKCITLWESLEEETVISKKLLLFQFLTVVLAGIVFGMLISPRKITKIASDNTSYEESIFDDEDFELED